MSELFFNRGGTDDSRTGINPKVADAFLHGPADNPTVIPRGDGLYTRQEIDDAFLARIDEIMAGDPGSLTLSDWRLWLQHAWKAEHGTSGAALRFGDKLVEEYNELTKALTDHIFHPAEGTREAVISEAGDVLWCLGAAVTNAGVSVQTELQTLLLKTAVGTVVFDRGQAKEPVWRQKMLQVATSTIQPVTIADLDELFELGYEPMHSPVMNIDEESYDDPERNYEALDMWQMNSLLPIMFRNNMEHQFGELDSDSYVYGDSKRYQDGIKEIAPYLILRTMYTVHAVAGATLAETVANNYKKISHRIEAGLIDHDDGERSIDLT